MVFTWGIHGFLYRCLKLSWTFRGENVWKLCRKFSRLFCRVLGYLDESVIGLSIIKSWKPNRFGHSNMFTVILTLTKKIGFLLFLTTPLWQTKRLSYLKNTLIFLSQSNLQTCYNINNMILSSWKPIFSLNFMITITDEISAELDKT